MEESTDGHRIKYAAPAFEPQRSGQLGFTQDQEVLAILKMYKAPLALAAPANWSFS